jgi:hypothetical protein
VSEATLRLMRRIDEQFLETPWYGSRQMARHLRRNGWCVGRHRVRRLMLKMDLAPIYQRPKTSEPHSQHRTWPYLLRRLTIDRPNQVSLPGLGQRSGNNNFHTAVPPNPASGTAHPAAAATAATPASSSSRVSQPENITSRPDDKETSTLIELGQDFLKNGDFLSARLLLQRAAKAGSAAAALSLGETFDPFLIQRLGAIGVQPDVAKAREWYQRAAQLGSNTAGRTLGKTRGASSRRGPCLVAREQVSRRAGPALPRKRHRRAPLASRTMKQAATIDAYPAARFGPQHRYTKARPSQHPAMSALYS